MIIIINHNHDKQLQYSVYYVLTLCSKVTLLMVNKQIINMGKSILKPIPMFCMGKKKTVQNRPAWSKVALVSNLKVVRF